MKNQYVNVHIPGTMDPSDARILIEEIEGLCEDYGAECITDAYPHD